MVFRSVSSAPSPWYDYDAEGPWERYAACALLRGDGSPGGCPWLYANNMLYHTFSIRRAKRGGLVLRGLVISACPEEVLDVLRAQGFAVVSACRLHTTIDPRKPLPLIRLLVERGESVQRLLCLKRLFGVNVRVDPYRGAGKIAQCHRCQRFGQFGSMPQYAPLFALRSLTPHAGVHAGSKRVLLLYQLRRGTRCQLEGHWFDSG